ncbi:MAG: alpha/beta hydrolase [Chloroflexota bacterium]
MRAASPEQLRRIHGREAMLHTDGRARALFGASVGETRYKDEVQIVQNMDTPLAIIHGAEEQLVNVEYLRSLTIPSLWRGEVQIIEDAGHATHWEQPDRFNAILTEFAADVIKGG